MITGPITCETRSSNSLSACNLGWLGSSFSLSIDVSFVQVNDKKKNDFWIRMINCIPQLFSFSIIQLVPKVNLFLTKLNHCLFYDHFFSSFDFSEIYFFFLLNFYEVMKWMSDSCFIYIFPFSLLFQKLYFLLICPIGFHFLCCLFFFVKQFFLANILFLLRSFFNFCKIFYFVEIVCPVFIIFRVTKHFAQRFCLYYILFSLFFQLNFS